MRLPILTNFYRLLSLTAVVIAFLFGGCAGYQPRPLTYSADLALDVNHLESCEATRHIGPAKNLSLTEMAILAVKNNPDLKAQRKRLGIAAAQLYSIKLLPDPQLSANLDQPTGDVSGTVNAFGLGLNYDIIPLINRGSRVESEKQALHQINLELLWQEWQVSQQARSLSVRWVSEKKRLALLNKMRDLYAQRYQRSAKALRRGDLTLDVNGTDLSALLDTISQTNQLQQAHNDTSHALKFLLGLAPEVQLSIADPERPETITMAQILKHIAVLPKQRPDLLALQAGYRSQEAKVRAAVLSQFPSLSIGISRARDTGSLYTNGFNIGLNLPLFSGNRGAIAVERATREKLRAEYQARLDQATVDADKLFRLQGIISDQQHQIDKYLPALEQLVTLARDSYRRGDIGALTFLNMETTWISKRLERISLDQTQWETKVALQTLLAIPDADVFRNFSGEGDTK